MCIRDRYYVIYGLKGSPYEDGYYYGRINLPSTYPMSPPSVIMLTPNGRFETNVKLCTSFTSYHPESWNSSWNIQTMLMGLISVMNGREAMLGGIQTSDEDKKKFAAKSLAFNLKQKEFNRIFSTHFPRLGIVTDTTPDDNHVLIDVPRTSDAPRNQRLAKKIVLFLLFVVIVGYPLYNLYYKR
eukprot:TRINITY_DN3687_c0_g1_i1.p1 TRINITY_DN3687_c0_g1~~TRINITY_DN3687_c0_g1_i1.p1  ORF type:complete len:184 (-),score=40.83 TRINITY_DN3687_c0_g1_i1:207-758(-)